MAKVNNIDEYRKRAAAGDPDAQYVLAWEYFKGEFVPKDVGSAIALLRQMEKSSPELARFNIAKIKYAEGDEFLVDDLRTDCAAGFGPSLYLMACYYLKKVGGKDGRTRAAEYFCAAAQNGHLPSEFPAWRYSKMGFRRRLTTIIPAFRGLVRYAADATRNEGELRNLT